MSVTVHPASEADFAGLISLDQTYETGPVLAIERSGRPPELTFRLRWQRTPAGEAVYDEYTEEGLRRALGHTDLFLVAEFDGETAGALMVMLPDWTDAGEITDLVVHRPLRQRGVGRALVEAAAEWGSGRDLRALWVEPRAENASAIEFYLSFGFRLSGFSDRLHANTDHENGRPTIYMYLELR